MVEEEEEYSTGKGRVEVDRKVKQRVFAEMGGGREGGREGGVG